RRTWSSRALTNAVMATIPSPPGRFSTTTGWPQRAFSRSANRRAPMSTPAPAPSGSRNLTGRSGQVGACCDVCAADGDVQSTNGPRKLKAISKRCNLRMGFSKLSWPTRRLAAALGSLRLQLDIRGLDDRPPFLDLGLLEGAERGRRLLFAGRDHQ